MTEIFMSSRIVDGKPRKVVVDNIGTIINRNPTKEELKGLEIFHEKSWRNKRRLKITKEQIIGIIRKIYEEKGKVPTVADFDNNPKYPCSGTVRNYFGGCWNDAIREAGLPVNCFKEFRDEELLGALLIFEEENGRPPAERDFTNNPKYPSIRPYIIHFGGWQKALKLVGLDVDTIVRKGIVRTTDQKARLAEMNVLENDEKMARDLSGRNCSSHFDGISKDGIYDVKGSKLYEEKYWRFLLDKCVDHYYLLAYDKDYKRLLYKWKIPGDFTEEDHIVIGINSNYKYNVENMKEFEITEKFKDIDLFKR